MKTLRHPIFKALLIALFVSYYVGLVAFLHVHRLNGSVVVHSHPYVPAPNGQAGHSHSASAFETIGLLDCFAAVTPEAVAVPLAVWSVVAVFAAARRERPVPRRIGVVALRAPPSGELR